MHSTLQIKDILPPIFSLLIGDRATLVNCACVCKTWHPMALDALWYEVPGLPELCTALGGIAYSKPPGYHAELPLSISDAAWVAFGAHASRVNTLKIIHKNYVPIYDAVFRELLIFSQCSLLLPKLRQLYLELRTAHIGLLRWSVTFLHAGVRHVDLDIGSFANDVEASKTGLVRLFKAISARSPLITYFSLGLRSLVAQTVEDALGNALNCLQHLQYVSIPYSSLGSPVVLCALSQLPHLTELETTARHYKPTSPNRMRLATAVRSVPELPVQAFPSLDKLSFSADLEFATQFLWPEASQRSLAPLITLIISGVLCKSDHITGLFTAVLAYRMTLEYLEIDTCFTGHDQSRINAVDLKLLSQLTELNTLIIINISTLQVSADDLSELTSGLPFMEYLSLNPIPQHVAEQPACSMLCFDILARNCPYLHTLGLYMNCEDLPSQDSPGPVLRHPRLRRLKMGVSTIADPYAVAMILHRITPPRFLAVEYLDPAEKSTFPQWIDLSLMPLAKLQEQSARWRKVNEYLPMIRDVHDDAIQELRAENNNLRNQVGWLWRENQQLRMNAAPDAPVQDDTENIS